MARKPQSFENHARIVPAYHFVTFGILVVNLVWAVYRLIVAFAADTLVTALLSVALLLLFFYARIFALTVQDRLIRLEMQLRLRGLLPPDLLPRAAGLTVRQLIALRFASDAELPDLCRKVLDERIQDQKAIKRLIRNWQEDSLRA
jgi:hypothetical protein